MEAAADVERFGDGDLASILAHRESAEVIEFPRRHSEAATLQSSTAAWEGGEDPISVKPSQTL